tara:strand:- start:723 stop:2084 length:1362 start_codon:yes stop_codon:yes gene_type:complete
MPSEILIIDDNSDIRFLISDLLKDDGYEVRTAANFSQALSEINKKLPDVAIIDVKLDKGDRDGIELLTVIKKLDKNLPVIIISGHANIQMAVDSLKKGAFEFVQKPFDKNRLLNFVTRAVENINLKRENQKLNTQLFYSYDLIGESEEIKKIKNLIDKVAKTDSRVFIFGSAGSGKELVARKLHKISQRSNKPFVIVNGALLEPERYELELFGSENSDGTINYGSFEKAQGGTLLIDEISEIPFETQAKILRVIIDQKFKRINGISEIKVNLRIISTTSKNIREEIEKGNFREDLYHRLNVVPVNIPPLSERTEDIPYLIKYFSEKISEINKSNKVEINPENQLLYSYSWPGNVRELRNLVERISILSLSGNISNTNKIINDSLSETQNENVQTINESTSVPLKKAREIFEKNYLISQLKKNNGNISKTADFIGMERSALHRKLKILGIKGMN